MARFGDVVEFTPGLHGIQKPRNLAIFLDRRRVKGVPWVRLLTLEGEKEVKAEHLTKRTFRLGYEGPRDPEAMRERLRFLVEQHTQGKLAEEADDDLARLEQELWELASRDASREAWTDEELAVLLYGAEPSPVQRKQVREALDRCRRAGTGRFQTTAGRGDTWRPWTREEHDAMRSAWRDLEALRARLVRVEETDDGRTFSRIELAAAGLTPQDEATLQWVRDAMAQFVEWDGVPQNGVAVAGIGGTGAVQAFGMDLHRALGFLAADWIHVEPTTTSSNYVVFLLETGLWTAQEAVAALVRRHVNQEPFFEHVPDPKAEAAAAAFPEPDLADDPGRTDLRHLECYTIDPPDAKDFDDAVGLEDLPDGRLRLWVHVADVSHYVRQDSLLDRHAKKRATSVYLPGRVLPMLPPRLADHLCSLRSDGDRFALSVGLTLDADGRVAQRVFHKAILRVRENLSYGEALRRAKAGEGVFPRLLETARRMRQHRRGLELETGELKVLLEASGFSALEKRSDEATRMIETFMVAANEAVAAHLSEQEVPQLYRCHPLPDRQKAERATHQLEVLGVDFPLDLPGPKPQSRAEAQAESLLDQLKAGGGRLSLFGGGVAAPRKAEPAPTPAAPPQRVRVPGFLQLSPEEREAWLKPFRDVVDRVAQLPDQEVADVATGKILACMGRAYYTPDNEGHFGLASTHYNHFTSPIRRYPDLVVHRNLKWWIDGRSGEPPHSQESLRALCEHCSDQERAADQLERRIKASALVLATLQEDGQAEGTARITGLTPTSTFLQRSDGIEARAFTRTLPGGPYEVDEWEARLLWPAPDGGEPRERARLGQKVRVRLTARDVAAGRTGATITSF
ncbi:MAG TPA: ribonuclease R family protein [Candidatus Thermoplasmatota archaeon]|nr:ribonuclease R family protein [Candidatus Thermoplasmatota archaeon]